MRARLLIVLLASIDSLRAAELVFDQLHVSLGRIEAVGDIEHEFPFRVEGEGVVEITDVRPSCGCIAPVLSKRRFASGEQGTLVMGIHAASQREGRRLYHVTLTTRSGTEISTAQVQLDLDLYKPIVVEPSNLLIYVNGQRAIRQTLTVKDQRPRALEITGVSATTAQLHPKIVHNPTSDDAVQQVELTINGEFPVGRSQERLVIATADPRHDTIVVPVTVVRSSRLRILPERLQGRRPKSAKPVTWQVLVSDSRGEPIRISSIECPDSRISVEWPKTTTPRCRLAVTVVPTGPEIESELIIHVAEPIQGELYLPIKVD